MNAQPYNPQNAGRQYSVLLSSNPADIRIDEVSDRMVARIEDGYQRDRRLVVVETRQRSQQDWHETTSSHVANHEDIESGAMSLPSIPVRYGLTGPTNRTENHQVVIRQQPEKSRVVVKGREKEKKPIDPPPILQLHIVNDPTFIHNPYLFCNVALWHPDEDRPAPPPAGSSPATGDDQLLVGQLVSSLHRLKDLDNSEKAFFVFGDLAVTITGRFRLRFGVWEYSQSAQYATFLKEATSNVFEVASAKEWDGVKESTPLSRAIADQGIKLRLRKESRHPKGVSAPAAGPPSTASTPIRPAYPQGADSAGASTSEPPSKRHRSFGAESGSGPSSNTTTPYPGYAANPGTAPPYGYPASSSGGMQPSYYSQQHYPGYPSSYGGYPYPQQSQGQYGMNPATSSYRQQGQPEGSSSSYPPPSSYAQGSYSYQPGSSYPAPAPGYSYGQQGAGSQYAGRGSMADPSNPPQLAPISASTSARAPQQQQQSPHQQPPQQGYKPEGEQPRPSYDSSNPWTAKFGER